MKLSLIIAYRKRETHLKTQIAWWKTQASRYLLSECEVIIVEADQQPSTWIQNEIAQTNIKYIYFPCQGVFHKTKALNLGLADSQGQFVAPFDVDLIPINDTLEKHLQMAERGIKLLMSGYRVMWEQPTIDVHQIRAVIPQTTIAQEDQPKPLWKYLIKQERFGVAPFFERHGLIEIQGWDEQFIGWGAEDQDIIERYLNLGYYFCRSPELIYLHLAHEVCQDWSEDFLTEQNRRYYYTKMQERKQQFS